MEKRKRSSLGCLCAALETVIALKDEPGRVSGKCKSIPMIVIGQTRVQRIPGQPPGPPEFKVSCAGSDVREFFIRPVYVYPWRSENTLTDHCNLIMLNCVVAGCYKSGRIKQITCKFFTFLKEAETCGKWLQLCGRPDITHPLNHRICSLHFASSVYQRNLKYEILEWPVPARQVRLKPKAVPTLHLPLTGEFPFQFLVFFLCFFFTFQQPKPFYFRIKNIKCMQKCFPLVIIGPEKIFSERYCFELCL